ncbi:MAG: phosphopantothenoylcysteine decarboxylase [Planctomycetota bacterium]
MRILVTAGPTREPVDSVRYLSNRSSGSMGYAIARRLSRRHRVTLVSGPTALRPPKDVEFVVVETAREMRREVLRRFRRVDAVVMCAAVTDYRPARRVLGKIRKGTGPLRLDLVLNPDILAELGRRKRRGQVLVGFALEARKGLARARRKLRTKKLDAILRNDLSTIGAAKVRGELIQADGAVTPINGLPKRAVAELIEKVILKVKHETC